MFPASTFALVLVAALAGAILAWWVGQRRRIRSARDEPKSDQPTAHERREWSDLGRAYARLQEQHRILQVRATEAEQELAALAYAVSHDLRAPVRGIDGFSQALTEDHGDRLDETAHDYLRRVRANARHLSALVDDLLSLSRVVRAPFHLERVDVSALARGIARDLSAGEPNRPVRWEVPANIVAVADRALLGEALRHLLANAWKFSAARDVAEVSLGVLPPDPEHPAGTVYQVRDNGVGFDMQYAGRLFGPFQRMHPQEDFPSGRGMGLALVQRIVRRHGGRVWAHSAPDLGTTLSFTLEGARTGAGPDKLTVTGAIAPLPAETGAAGASFSQTTTV